MTDTQVMAALEPIQVDINAANSFFNRMDSPIRHAMLAQAFARHRIASSPAATLPDCIVNGDVEAWLFSHPDRDGDMEAGRLELFNFRMGYAAPVTPPAGDAEELACPFCSGFSVVRQDDDPGYPFYVTFEHTAECPLYAVPTDLFKSYRTEAEAIAAWTSRPSITTSPVNSGNILVSGQEYVPLEAYREAMAGWKASNALAPVAGDAALRKALESALRALDSDSLPIVRRAARIQIKHALATPPSVPAQQGWQDIATAPRDGSYILAIVAPNRGRYLEHQVGRVFVIRHEGKTVSDYDLGWAVYPGFGGASDYDFTHWMPLPATPPAQDQTKGTDHG